MTAAPTVDELDALLPQTQCTRCGYAGCLPYAQALVDGAAQINQCPPGGSATIAQLAQRMGRPVMPLNPANGRETEPLVAVIDESRCIGCAKCLPPCPVDAIIGAARQMHTVLFELCNGCELCIAPCPVDCIAMQPRAALPPAVRGSAPTRAQNRRRFQARQARLARDSAERSAMIATRKQETR